MAHDAVLVDAGTGNLRSVHHALISLGYQVKVTGKAKDVLNATRIILPGVGAFAGFMSGISALGFDDAIMTAVEKGTPLLGICVGMQALFNRSEEMGSHKGLSLIPGTVQKFKDQTGLKIPHTGWNQLWPQKECQLMKDLDGGCYAYFNHSYYCVPQNDFETAVNTDYGISFCSIVQNGQVFGVQFHPEKSQQVGLHILENFLKL